MKRKILSVILVLMLIPFASLFSACKKGGYNLNNLQTDFHKLQTQNENVELKNGKYVFDYSKHDEMYSVVENSFPYKQLNDYNYIYENIMAFSFEYIDECSNNSVVKDAKYKDNIYRDLVELQDAVDEVDTYVNMFAEIIIVSEDIYDVACTSTFTNLLYSYDELFRCASNFNNSLADLYFNYILPNGNPDISKVSLNDFDVNVVVNKFDARVKYQISNLSQCFYEMVINREFSYNLVQGDEFLDLTVYNYKSNVTKVSKDFDEQVAAEKAGNSANKSRYYELSVQAYNIQETMKNDNAKFIHAMNKISYAGLDLAEASAHDKMCVEIIDYRYELVTIYNSILVEMLQITGA